MYACRAPLIHPYFTLLLAERAVQLARGPGAQRTLPLEEKKVIFLSTPFWQHSSTWDLGCCWLSRRISLPGGLSSQQTLPLEEKKVRRRVMGLSTCR